MTIDPDKKQREDDEYVVLSRENCGSSQPPVPASLLEDSDSSQKSPTKKYEGVNKLLKEKAKNSDDEETKGNESDSSEESVIHSSRNEPTGVINRKKKRSLTYYANKNRQQMKQQGLDEEQEKKGKIRPTLKKPMKPKETAVQTNDAAVETSFKRYFTQSDTKSVKVLTEDKDNILEHFDSFKMADDKTEEKFESPTFANEEKAIQTENLDGLKIPELKRAVLETIPENEFPGEVEIMEEGPKDVMNDQILAKAHVSYEGLENLFATPVVNDYIKVVKEEEKPTMTTRNAEYFNLLRDLATPSTSESVPVSVQPRKNPWNVWPGLYEDSLGMPTTGPSTDPSTGQVEDDTKKDEKNWPDETLQLRRLLFEVSAYEEEKRKDKMIANFFAEEARCLKERDIDDLSVKIEISKIEIYAEDIKRYHQSLKYHRGPVDHDMIFTTVETALNFIEKLVKEREKKKKVGFLPQMFEKCLKSKATREREEQERKKKEEEAKKNKDPLKPKMWLVFNRYRKEKVIICTPGEFYDSD